MTHLAILSNRAIIMFIGLLLLALACNLTSAAQDETPAALNTAVPTPTGDPNTPFVTITMPTGAEPITVDASGFTVRGQVQGSFENNVIVQALDAQGQLLQQQVVTAISDDIGQVGDWEVMFTPGVAVGTTGSLYAFFLSARDGSTVAEARLAVIYGSP